MREKRVTIYDIAEKAGVSVGTVNRALSNKPRISKETKKLVLETAEKLGYKANVAAQGLRRLPITIGAILYCPIDEYVDSIIDGIKSSASDLEKYNVTVDIRKIDCTSSDECILKTEALVKEFSEKNYNGIVFFMSLLIDEMKKLSELEEKNIFYATVANDIPESKRVLYVGVDAYMAGQMAAELLELSCAGRDVALLVTSTTSPVNMDYINGFMKYAGENVFSSIKIYRHYDEREKIIEATQLLLQENPNLCGIYMATASSAIACNYIRNVDKKNLTIITTDLLKETQELLNQKIASATIFQNPYRQGRNVIKLFYNYITKQTDSGINLITPQIVLSSNLESYLQESEL